MSKLDELMSLRIHGPLKDRLKAAADQRGVSMNKLVLEALHQYLNSAE